jgi:hypothetical protein
VCAPGPGPGPGPMPGPFDHSQPCRPIMKSCVLAFLISMSCYQRQSISFVVHPYSAASLKRRISTIQRQRAVESFDPSFGHVHTHGLLGSYCSLHRNKWITSANFSLLQTRRLRFACSSSGKDEDADSHDSMENTKKLQAQEIPQGNRKQRRAYLQLLADFAKSPEIRGKGNVLRQVNEKRDESGDNSSMSRGGRIMIRGGGRGKSLIRTAIPEEVQIRAGPIHKNAKKAPRDGLFLLSNETILSKSAIEKLDDGFSAKLRELEITPERQVHTYAL